MKTIAVIVMLLASTSFGAISLSLDKATVQPGGTVTLSIDSMSSPVTGIGLYAIADKDQVATIVSVTKRHAQLNDGPANNPAGFVLGTDPGSTGSFGLLAASMTTGAAATGAIMDITVTAPDISLPVVVTILGDYALLNGEADMWAPVSFTITPEPTSMLLLAGGAAFFARRRRA